MQSGKGGTQEDIVDLRVTTRKQAVGTGTMEDAMMTVMEDVMMVETEVAVMVEVEATAGAEVNNRHSSCDGGPVCFTFSLVTAYRCACHLAESFLVFE